MDWTGGVNDVADGFPIFTIDGTGAVRDFLYGSTAFGSTVFGSTAFGSTAFGSPLNLLLASLSDWSGKEDAESTLYQHHCHKGRCNIGNIFFERGLFINGTSNDNKVRAEAEYLFRQAKKAYEQSLKYDNSHWDSKHNLDRLLTLLPNEPTPGVGDSDSPGLIMGNIPVGLP